MTKKAVWTLPVNVHPAKSVDWCIPVPDDPYYRAAFAGALLNLASAYNWQDDEAHTAKQVALVWREIIDSLKKCTDCPEIETGEEWEDTLAICESLRWNNGVLQGFCCGEWVDIPTDDTAPIPGGSVQPSSGSRPSAGQSKCVQRSMTARDVYLVPFGVQNGDIITVSARDGAWSDDGVLWTCTDGTPFSLGSCSGSRYHSGGDPDATLYHGQLMLSVGGQYISATDGPVTLSGLTGQQQLTVMPNFTPGAFAGGTIQYQICVQNGATPPPSDWSHTFNFALSDNGFTPGITAIYVPGVGFQTANSPGAIDLALPGTAGLTGYTVFFATDGPDYACDGGQQQIEVGKRAAGGGAFTSWHLEACDISGAFTSTTFDGAFTIAAADLIDISWFNGGASFFNIVQLELRGTGVNPF